MKRVYDAREYFESEGHSEFDKRYLYFSHVARTLIGRAPSELHALRALDVGCAGGELVHALRELGVTAYGTDISRYALSHTTSVVTPYLVECDVEVAHLPFMSSSFDLVTCLDLLEHVKRPDHLIMELRRVLRSGGIAFVSIPCVMMEKGPLRQLQLRAQPNPLHINMHSKSFWLRLFTTYGLEFNTELHELIQVEDSVLPSRSWVRNLLVKLGLIKLWRSLLMQIHGMFLFKAR